MKKVLYISYDGMTDPLGQSQVIPYLRELTKKGYLFTILSVEKKEKLQKNGELIRNILADAGIGWETLLFTSRPPVLSKLYDQYQLNKKVNQLHKAMQFDMLHCRSYVAAEAGLRLKNKLNIPFLLDMRGFWVDERVDSGIWNLSNPLHRFFYKVYKRKEKKYFSQSAHIISLTHKGKNELIINYGVPENKVSIIPCCADLDLFDYKIISEEKKSEIRQQLGIDKSQKVLSYLGSLGGWYMTEEMLDFFAILQTKIPGTVFLFITHDKKEMIIEKAVQRGIAAEAIRVQPAGRADVPSYLSLSDWSIFFIKDVYSKKASSPTKQGEIMGMGIPLICNDIGDTGRIVSEASVGIVIESVGKENYNSVIEQLDKLSNTGKKEIRQSAFKHYDLQTGIKIYNKVYQEI